MNGRRGLKSWLGTTMSENAAVDRLNALVSKLVAAIRPPPNVSVSEWATQNRVLSPEASAEQGRWRNSRTPYLVEIMDAFSDPRIHHIVVVVALLAEGVDRNTSTGCAMTTATRRPPRGGRG